MGPRLTRLIEAVLASSDFTAAVDFHPRAFDLYVLGGASGPEIVMGVPGCTGGRIRIVAADVPVPSNHPAVWELGPRLLGM